MTVLIQSGSSYSKEQLLNPLTYLILEGFESKFTHHFFSKEESKMIASTLSLFLVSEKSKNLIIAEKNNKICGILYFITKEENSKLLKYYLKQSFTKIKLLKVSLLLVFLSHRPKENEKHIDFITVSPAFRDLGIGRKLIDFCKETNDKEVLTLHVAKNNVNAVHLYQSEGFEIDKDLSSLTGLLLTGIKEWWYMRLNINKKQIFHNK